MYLIGFPLLLIPFAIYNMIAFLFRAGFNDTLFSIQMLSKATLNVTTSDLLIILSIFLLFIEILKSTRVGTRSIIDHVLSFVLFIVMAGEFMIVPLGGDVDLPADARDLLRGRGRRLLGLDPHRAARYRRRRSGSGDPLVSGRSESPHEPRLPSTRPLARLCPRRHGGDLASAGEPRGDRNPARGRYCRRRRGHGGCALERDRAADDRHWRRLLLSRRKAGRAGLGL